MSGSRTRTGRRVQGDMGEVTTQGDNATESMNQARLPRQVYEPNTEPDRPCLLARTTSVELALGCLQLPSDLNELCQRKGVFWR